MAAAPQFAPSGVWSARVSSSCSLLGIGPLSPSHFLRWAQCPSSRLLHQTLPILCHSCRHSCTCSPSLHRTPCFARTVAFSTVSRACGHAVLAAFCFAAQFPCAASLSGGAACRSMGSQLYPATAPPPSHRKRCNCFEATLALGTAALCESLWPQPRVWRNSRRPKRPCCSMPYCGPDLPTLSSGPGYASPARPWGPKVKSRRTDRPGRLLGRPQASTSWSMAPLPTEALFAAMQPCMVSPLTRTGHPQPRTVEVDGAVLKVAERRKRSTYPEFARGPQGLRVFGR